MGGHEGSSKKQAHTIIGELCSVSSADQQMESSIFNLGPDHRIPFLQCLHVLKGYGDGHRILHDVQLQVYKGDTVCVVGETGCGKTTLVRLLFGLDTPDSGQVTIDGVNPASMDHAAVVAFRRKVSVVFQDLKLMNKRNVHENVALPLILSQKEKHFIEERVDRSLRQVNLKHKSLCCCSGLSIGERQLLAVARATVNDPVLIFADEPTGHQDDSGVQMVASLLKELGLKGTTLFVTTKDSRLPPLLPSARLMALSSGRIVGESPPLPRGISIITREVS